MEGIDVSKWQGAINWTLVKDSGVGFAMIRDGYGKTGLDKMFDENYRKAKYAGVGVGVYHYSYADSVEDAKKEAEFCLKNISGKQFEMPIVYDIEDPAMMALSTRVRTDCCKAFCEEVENAGYYAMIYANPNWLKNYLFADELIGRFDLWLAQWGDKEPSYQCGIWQYSETGKVRGILSNVDLDISYKNYRKIMKRDKLNGFGGISQETEVQIPLQHTVGRGENLTKIAAKYGTTVDNLAMINGIKDKNKIYIGQILKLQGW